MAYEYNLRGLFRPQLDQLPLSEQVVLYQQRDMTASHLLRIGASLFESRGMSTIRKRMIDSIYYYSSAGLSPHSELFDRRLSGGYPHFCTGWKSAVHSDSDCNNSTLPELLITSEDLDVHDKWIADRQRLRGCIEGPDALKHWLRWKEQTPMENYLLTNLHARKASKEEETDKLQVGTARTYYKVQSKARIIEEITRLEQHLITHRPLFVHMLTSADKLGNKSIRVNDMLNIFNRMKIQLSQETTEVLLDTLEVDDGLLRYNEFLKGEILRRVKRSFQRQDSKWTHNKIAQSIAGNISRDSPLLQLGKQSLSTMDEKNAKEYKQEELKQFALLLDFCKGKGITLDWKMAEKALLLPPDQTTMECLAALRQPGLGLLSQFFAHPPEDKERIEKKHPLTYEGWGQPYKELRGRKKADYVKLSTGKVKIQPKTDCWLTFRDYQALTEHIRSRPGFKYQDHGLPNNRAFWPGVMMDKLRLWLPNETLLDKPYSLYNIYQPIHQPQGSFPLVRQKSSWPENDNGYVQFGCQTRKLYHI